MIQTGAQDVVHGADVAGGTAVVVGAAQGIGESIGRRLAESGRYRRVVLADIQSDLVNHVAEELRASSACDLDALSVDMSSPASIQELVEAAPGTSALAVVGGVFRAAPSLEASWDDFQRILEVNLLGAFFVSQAFAREMVRDGGGSIVAVCSIAARMPRMRQAAYCASKAGMRMALRVLAMETVPLGVRINFVSPGPTDTPMMRTLAADHAVDDLAHGSSEAFRPRIPAGRVGRSDDVARAVAFLLSDEAEHIAFHDLYVDGGESLGL